MRKVLACNSCYSKEGYPSVTCTLSNPFIKSINGTALMRCPFSGKKVNWKIKVVKTKKKRSSNV